MKEIKIIPLLEDFDFPEFSLADLNPKVDACLLLDLYGSYCMHNHIRDKYIVNKSNPSLHFISRNFGKDVILEIRYKDTSLIEKIGRKYNRFTDGYEPTSFEPYDLVYREDMKSATV